MDTKKFLNSELSDDSAEWDLLELYGTEGISSKYVKSPYSWILTPREDDNQTFENKISESLSSLLYKS